MGDTDSEPIFKKLASDNKASSGNDLISMLADGVSKTNYKKYMITFIVFILLSSDVFIEYALAAIPNATDSTNRYATTKGVVVQGILLVFIAIFLDILDNAEVI